MRPLAVLALVAILAAFVVGVQVGKRDRPAPLALAIPAPPLTCADVVSVDLVTGDSTIRITTSATGHRVVSEPGSGRKFLMLPVAR